MTSDYYATPKNFQAIESALRTVWSPKLDFIFSNRSILKKTVIVSYDSKFIYLWTLKTPPFYSLDKIPHALAIEDRYHYAWFAGIRQKEIEDLLPSSIKIKTHFTVPRISGGLLTPFITLQKAKNLPLNPYTSRESYLATIIHEFGHIYWNQFKLWWPSNKKENLDLIQHALQLYSNKEIPNHHLPYLPVTGAIGEVFAFCTEYTASSFFWPKHKALLDKFIYRRLQILLEHESQKNLDQEDSVIEPTKNPHDFASIYGKITLSCYPGSWPQFLIQRQPLGGVGG